MKSAFLRFVPVHAFGSGLPVNGASVEVEVPAVVLCRLAISFYSMHGYLGTVRGNSNFGASDIVCASLAVIEAVVSGKDDIGRSTCEKAIHTIGEIGTNTDDFCGYNPEGKLLHLSIIKKIVTLRCQ